MGVKKTTFWVAESHPKVAINMGKCCTTLEEVRILLYPKFEKRPNGFPMFPTFCAVDGDVFSESFERNMLTQLAKLSSSFGETSWCKALRSCEHDLLG